MLRFRLSIIPLLLFLSSGGCGRGQIADGLVPVSGSVRYQGQPLEQGIVGFSTADGQFLYASRIIKGKYTLQASQDVRGVPPGEYRVSIQSSPELPPMEDTKELAVARDRPENIPEKYFDPKLSGLTATVPQTGGVIDFDLTK